MEDKTIINCDKCHKALRVPTDRGAIKVRCPHCQANFNWTPDISQQQKTAEIKMSNLNRSRWFKNLFSSKVIPSPEEKAKAVYHALMSQGITIIQDLLSSAPDEFKDSTEYKDFLGNEVGVIMCLHSTREGYERYFADSQESKLFVTTLYSLFKHHLQISWDDFDLYLRFGENSEDPDKILMQIFTGRIVAFLNQDDEPFNKNVEKTLLYAWHQDALIYAEYYVAIFESICRILDAYAGESANIKEIRERANDLDERLK